MCLYSKEVTSTLEKNTANGWKIIILERLCSNYWWSCQTYWEEQRQVLINILWVICTSVVNSEKHIFRRQGLLKKKQEEFHKIFSDKNPQEDQCLKP